MSKIDEIMGAVGRHGDDCIRDADAASASFEGLRDLIAAALADAERKGAEAMRGTICALPLPAGTVNVVMDREHGGLTFAPAKREPVLLTDAAIAEAFLSRCPAHLRGEHDARDMQARPDVMAMGRAIEAAVLAANGLGVRRG